MFLLVPAYSGCPGQTVVEWLLLLLLQWEFHFINYVQNIVCQNCNYYSNHLGCTFLTSFFPMYSGDLWSYNAEKDTYVVSPEPYVTVLDIDKSHCFVILASDGLWHVIRPAQAVDIVAHLTSHMVATIF